MPRYSISNFKSLPPPAERGNVGGRETTTRKWSLATGAIAVGVIALSFLVAPAFASFPGANGRIAYSGNAGDAGRPYHVFTIKPGGSDPQQVTHSRYPDSYPAWSASGRRIAFSRTLANDQADIFTVGATGGPVTRITHDAADSLAPYFAPGGHRIVFTAYRPGGTSSIVSVATDGTDRRPIVSGGVFGPEYSPSGDEIVFSRSPRGPHGAIWIVRPNGSHLERLTRPAPRFDVAPDYSPNGRRIVFLRCSYATLDPGPDCNLIVMRANGSNQHSIGRVNDVFDPTYSPGGRTVVFNVKDPTLNVSSDLFAVSAAGSTPWAITHNSEHTVAGGWAEQPSWQPMPLTGER